ncbi:hypothetical protein PNP85_14960 [Halobacterium salinarum]|nr:hypothetical protein [Halobacterium salinarum]MDL0129226.1 hypothetical protein [Halobacterium salinarum]MDL0140797.1 hypothetical protein [Halobacterium salinarum]
MNQWEVRAAKFVGEKAVAVERVREDDAISLTVIEAERYWNGSGTSGPRLSARALRG